MRYSIIQNATSAALIALPATDALSDNAFEKGWRICSSDISYTDLQLWKEKFNLEVMTPAQFYLDYLVDKEMTEEDTAYIEACLQDSFYEASTASDDHNIDDEGGTDFLFEEVEEEALTEE